MSKQWRIFIVEDDENLNRSIVNALRENYVVQGAISIADAVRTLWSEEYDVVVCNVKTTSADGLELLQWLRAYRPQVRLILVGEGSMRMQALEKGAVGYLEGPLNIQVLKEELRRLLQQTGFSASLDSFDLLDVIQMINMSRKNIALLVNTGLEEQGMLRFQNGELIWVQYGILLGEEAFFALAAYKNGTVTHQEWNEYVTPNVKQPLSRLILQALQYRAKYADIQPSSGKHEAVPSATLQQSHQKPLAFPTETPANLPAQAPSSTASIGGEGLVDVNETTNETTKEWWQLTDKIAADRNRIGTRRVKITAPIPAPPAANEHRPGAENNSVQPPLRKTPATSHTDLPSWLTDQPTVEGMPAIGSIMSAEMSQARTIPPSSSSAEWQMPSSAQAAETISWSQATGLPGLMPSDAQYRSTVQHPKPPTASPEWQLPEQDEQGRAPGGQLQRITTPRNTSGALSNALPDGYSATGKQRVGMRNANYASLVSTLQTLAYSINGFIATAVISLDGQTLAQVAVDDLDISQECKHFSTILRGVLQFLDQGAWGQYEDTVVTSAKRHMLTRLVGSEKNAFQVLITTREAEPSESLKVMAHVESAIAAALR